MLRRVTRGFPSLRAVRSIVDQVCDLFDRRCRTDTALEKLGRLRARVRRFRSLRETLSKLFDTSGPWTQAGGVRAEDWPAWIRPLKDF